MNDLKQFILDHISSKYTIIDIKKTGYVYIGLDCSKKDYGFSKLKNPFIKVLEDKKIKDMTSSYCLHEVGDKEYFLKTKMIIMKEAVAKKNGFNSNFSSSFSVNHFSIDFSSYLDLLEKSKQIKLVAQPNIYLSSGVLARIGSGGEIAVDKEHTKYNKYYKSTAWKAYGMDLMVTLFKIYSSFFRVNFTLKVKIPSFDDYSSFRSYEVSGSKLMSLEKPQIAGEIKYLSDQKVNKDFSFFKKIPIISPLFSSSFFQNGKNHLYLIFTIYEKKDL